NPAPRAATHRALRPPRPAPSPPWLPTVSQRPRRGHGPAARPPAQPPARPAAYRLRGPPRQDTWFLGNLDQRLADRLLGQHTAAGPHTGPGRCRMWTYAFGCDGWREAEYTGARW